MTKIEELLKNEVFVKELLKQETKEDVVTLFKNSGVDITDKEVDELSQSINILLSKEGELNEEALNGISGGAFVGFIIAGVGLAILGKAAQEGMDYTTCKTSGKPFWKHKNQNYCDKYE